MFFDKKIKALELKEQAEKQNAIQKKEMMAFWNAYRKNDYFTCVKKLGILEYLGVKDILFFTGLTYKVKRDYDTAIDMLKKIPQTSPRYLEGEKYLIEIFRDTGKYVQLDELIKKGYLRNKPLLELLYRLICLWKSDSTWVIEHADDIQNSIESRDEIRVDNQNAGIYFQICFVLAKILVEAGEMINRVAVYKDISDYESDWESDLNLQNFIRAYDKCIVLLATTQCVKSELLDGFSLKDYALADKTWDDKINILQDISYHKRIIQIIVNLLNFDNHKCFDERTCFLGTVKLCTMVNPQSIAELVKTNMEVLKAAYIDGDTDAIDIARYVYGEIKGIGKDAYKLGDYLEKFVQDCSEIHKIGKDIAVVRKLPRKAYVIWQSAERAYNIYTDEETGMWDYSFLSLQYFRLFEIIIADKLLHPLVKRIDFDLLSDKISKCHDDERKKMWVNEASFLKEIKDGMKESFELGTVYVFLDRLIRGITKKEECAMYINDNVNLLLSDSGKIALRNRKMLNIIDRNKRNMYRNPGAHTGYRPFSVAYEAREYVLKMLSEVLDWFN